MDQYTSVAIDGPAGSGKSTVAREAARRLKFKYIDTGAMYRAVTWLALKRNIGPGDERGLVKLANELKIDIIGNNGGEARYFIEGSDITTEIRSPGVTGNVSRVSAVPGVRKALVDMQRRMAAGASVVMEGRDIGTAVLPDARYKFYITASPPERARRRLKDYTGMGIEKELDELTREIEKRDRMDSTRPVDPLRPAADACIIDTTDMAFEDVVSMVVNKVLEGV